MNLKLTEPIASGFQVHSFDDLERRLLRASTGTSATSHVGQAAPFVFGSMQERTVRFFRIGQIYYVGSSWLDGFAVGDCVQVSIEFGHLRIVLIPPQ